MNVDEILYILFRHKGKILLCSAIGIAAAAIVFFNQKAVYESQAKLLVRYVVDRSAVDTLDGAPKTPGGYSGEGIIQSEIEILTSWDLAKQVAEAVGIDRLQPGVEQPSEIGATHAVIGGVEAKAPRGNNVIFVSYKNHDPKLAVRVLEELVARYFVMHLEVHRSADAFNFVAQQTDQVRARLNQIEEELKELKTAAGVSSLNEGVTRVTAAIAATRDALQMAETERAEQKARVTEIHDRAAAQARNPAVAPLPVPNQDVLAQHQGLLTRLDHLRQNQVDLLSRMAQPAQSPAVITNIDRARQLRTGIDPRTEGPQAAHFEGSDRQQAEQLARERYRQQNDTGFSYQRGKKDLAILIKEAEQEILAAKANVSPQTPASREQLANLSKLQIETVEKQITSLESRFPGLVQRVEAAAPAGPDLSADHARIAGIEARIDFLKAKLLDLETRNKQLNEIAPRLAQLERTREIEDANLKYFQASLEKARIDEALDPSKIPNISAVQKPSPPMLANENVKKTLIGLAGGGVALGLGLAFLIELLMDRTVKRPLELQNRLGIPLLISIPDFRRKKNRFLRLRSNGSRASLTWPSGNGHAQVAAWEAGHFIRPYADAIRDRLGLYFELNGMTHKPKLVAVTALSGSAGTSTIAAGLAAALSETGDGKVLLVDMNFAHPEVHPFFDGSPAFSLAELQEGENEIESASDNLFLAAIPASGPSSAHLGMKKLYDLMPGLKASDFDYIIFDMPPLSETSPTVAIAGLMDKVLVVVESCKINRDFLKRTFGELMACRASASAIFNRNRPIVPRWLGADA